MNTLLYLNLLFFIGFCFCQEQNKNSSIIKESTGVNDKTEDNVTYTTKYDNVDIDEILLNDRLLGNYVKCLKFEGPCTPDAKTLRDILPDAVQSNCTKCSEKQKIGSDKVTHFLIDNKPDTWKSLELLYDPEGNFRKQYLKSKLSMKSNNTKD